MQGSIVDSEIIEGKMRRVFRKTLTDEMERVLAPKLVFFVGAGISHVSPSCLPLFKELNKSIIRLTTGGQLDEKDCETLADDIRPEVVLQILMEILSKDVMYKLLEWLKGVMTGTEPNPNHFLLAQVLNQGGWVFTTNYDNLIEKACDRLSIHVQDKICYNETHFEEFRKRHRDVGDVPGGYLFKLHGTIEDFESILATLRHVGKGLALSKTHILKYFLKNFSFCFMGYSCQDDFDILPVLLENPCEKGMIWFKYSEREIGEIVWGKDVIRYEKEKEENKPLGERRNWETANVNGLLLRSTPAFKLIGNSSRLVEQITPPIISKSRNKGHLFPQQIEGISNYYENLIAGHLFLYLEEFQKAEKHFKKAENSAQNDLDKAVAQRWLAETYYREEAEKYEEAIEILTRRTLPIYEKLPEIYAFEIAQIKTDIANNFRMLKDFPEALKNVEDAKRLFESKRKESIEKEGKEKYELEYARCLNILGLTHYQGRNTQDPLPDIEKALNLCEESRDLREKHGEISLTAASENAMGLIYYEKAKYLSEFDKEKALQLLEEKSFTYLKKALSTKQKVGDYRGWQQCYRNLVLAYVLSAELAFKEVKQKYLQDAQKLCEEGTNYIKGMPSPPKNRQLEFLYRMGEAYLKLNAMNVASEVLKEVVIERRRREDWHNEARALDKLCEAYEKAEEREKCKSCCLRIMEIYQEVLYDEGKLNEMKLDNVKFENATKGILPNTKASLVRMGLISEAEKVDNVLKELKEKIPT